MKYLQYLIRILRTVLLLAFCSFIIGLFVQICSVPHRNRWKKLSMPIPC